MSYCINASRSSYKSNVNRGRTFVILTPVLKYLTIKNNAIKINKIDINKTV